LEIGPRFQVFLANFLLRMRRNGHKTTSGQILTPNLKFPWAGSYSRIRMLTALAPRFIRVLHEKLLS